MVKNNLDVLLQDKCLDEKLDIIQVIWDSEKIIEEDLEVLSYLSVDEEEEVRIRVAEVLVFSNSSKAENILVKLLLDKSELVRANSCDSLCNSSSLEVLNLLKIKVLKDRSSLVRGYAALSIADIVTNIAYNREELKIFFRLALVKERIVWVKINYYKVLYMLGDETCLLMIIDALNNKAYRNRCAAANILSELATAETIVVIRKAFVDRLKIETATAVRSVIDDFVQLNN